METTHKYTKRKNNHDYRSPCHYHIIIKKNPSFPNFGVLTGNPHIPYGQKGCASVEKNLAGKIIGSHFFNIASRFPFMRTYQYRVMPDHVHVFLQVKKRMEKPLGYYIGSIKQNIAKEYSEKTNQRVLSKDIFEENFTDKIVYLKRDFNIIFQYIQQNPQRLAMVKINRDFYNRRPAFVLDGIEYEGYGNHYLMDNPFKKNVWVHGNASDKEKKDLMEECLYQSFGGGVLVSAFISKDEKNIRDEAEKIGGKIILVQKDPFPEKYKPADHNFRLCSQGKLLIIAPKVSFGKNLNREICRKMNLLAEKIASEM